MNKTNILYSVTIGLFSTALILSPMVYAADEDDNEAQEEGEGTCMDCGIVSAIKAAEQEGSSGLVGAATGAVAGGIAGNQVGQTSAASSTIGQTASTIIGMVGGAVGGHYAEKAMTTDKNWIITVHMNNGASRTITTTSSPQVKVGEHVRVTGDNVMPYTATAHD